MRVRLLLALALGWAWLGAAAQSTPPPLETPAAPQAGATASGQPGKAPRPGPACIPLAELSPEPAEGQGQGNSSTSAPVGRDICVEAHVYDVVELADGTRFLDVCPGTVPDEDCRFVLLSRAADREEVGDLRRLRDQDIRLRGTLRTMHGRLGMVISHARQFRGGPEKFKPNPRLLRDFNGQSDQMPVRDPNLSPAGHHRSFMNSREQEPLPAGKR